MISRDIVGTHNTSLARIENNPPGHCPNPPIDDFSLSNLTQVTGYAEIHLGAGVLREDLCLAGSSHVAAPDVHTDPQVGFMFSLLVVNLPKTLMEEASCRDPRNLHFELLQTAYLQNPRITHLVEQPANFSVVGTSEPLFGNQTLVTLAGCRVQASRQFPVVFDRVPTLSDKQVSFVIQKMEDEMDRPVTLGERAALVDMSIFQFSRTFRIVLGASSYRYLLLRRVSRTTVMLQDAQVGLAEIAYTCGFSSQAYMTTAFAKYSGTWPGSVRRALAS